MYRFPEQGELMNHNGSRSPLVGGPVTSVDTVGVDPEVGPGVGRRVVGIIVVGDSVVGSGVVGPGVGAGVVGPLDGFKVVSGAVGDDVGSQMVGAGLCALVDDGTGLADCSDSPAVGTVVGGGPLSLSLPRLRRALL